MAYKKLLFLNVRVSDVENYGLYAALIIGCLRSECGRVGDPETGKFCLTLKDIANYTGLSYKTVQRNVPTEEMGWRHFCAYKPGTLEKTTWWEPIDEDTDGKSKSVPQTTSAEVVPQTTCNINNKNNKEYAPHTHSGYAGAHPTTTFPLEAENGAAAEKEGGVVKITTPPDMVDLRKKQTAHDKRKKEFEFCQELLNRMGVVGVKVGGVFHKRIMQLKAQGYDDETLRQVATEAKTARLKDDFYAEPMKAFSESGVSGLIARIEKRKAKRDDGWSEMERQGFYV